MRWFVRAPGVLLAPVGDGWVAYSALSGETHLLNPETVAVVEALGMQDPVPSSIVCKTLSDECGVDVAELESTLQGAWGQLIDAGLIREVAGDQPAPG